MPRPDGPPPHSRPNGHLTWMFAANIHVKCLFGRSVGPNEGPQGCIACASSSKLRIQAVRSVTCVATMSSSASAVAAKSSR